MKLNFRPSLFSSLLAVIALKHHFWPFVSIYSQAFKQTLFFGQKWHLEAITAKSEENGLGLKIDFTSPKVSQRNLWDLLLPYLKTRIFKNQISPMFLGFDNTFHYQYAHGV